MREIVLETETTLRSACARPAGRNRPASRSQPHAERGNLPSLPSIPSAHAGGSVCRATAVRRVPAPASRCFTEVVGIPGIRERIAAVIHTRRATSAHHAERDRIQRQPIPRDRLDDTLLLGAASIRACQRLTIFCSRYAIDNSPAPSTAAARADCLGRGLYLP